MNAKGYDPYDHALQWPHITKADMRGVQSLADVMRDQVRRQRERERVRRERVRRLERMAPVILAGLFARDDEVAATAGDWRANTGLALMIAQKMADAIDRTTA